MKIAVTYEAGQVFQHFGHTPAFKIYEIAEGNVINEAVAETNGSGHGALAGFLQERGVNALICGGIGGGARAALADAGVVVYGGVSGEADDAVASFLAGDLNYDPCATCSHHHGEHDHDCGSHGCGSHDCGSHSCG